MDAFRFAPELFEVRSDVMAALGDRGYEWLSHYRAVDPVHDAFGIEVCGINDLGDATQILAIVTAMFPGWRPSSLEYKDYGREPGWKVKVVRDREASGDWRESVE